MFAATVRGMLAHKLRLALTTASIALGVAFLAGTLILTDTMNAGLRPALRQGLRRHRRRRRQRGGVHQSAGAGRERPIAGNGPRPGPQASTASRAAEGSVSGYALITDNDGKAVLTQRRRPDPWATACRRDETLRGDVELSHRPRPAGAATRSRSTPARPRSTTSRSARRSRSCSAGRRRQFTVVGTVGSAARRTSAARPPRTSTPRPRSRCSARPATSTRSTCAPPTASATAELAKRIDAVLPDGAEAVTGAHVAKENVRRDQAQASSSSASCS